MAMCVDRMRSKLPSVAAIVLVATTAALSCPSPVSANEVWMTAGVPVINQEEKWRGARADVAEMWTPDAPWKSVSQQIQVVLFSPGSIARAKDDDVLKQAFADMKRRNVAFALEAGLLTKTDKCQATTEAYLDSIDTLARIVDRIHRAGGELRYLAMDEPFYYGHQYAGAGACHEPATELAQRVAETIAVIRKTFPNVQVGDEEVIDSSRSETDELSTWVDAFRAATGQNLAFLHADVAWSGAAIRNLAPLATALKAKHVPLGIIYNADSDPTSDQAWEQNAIEHFSQIESVMNIHPEQAVFQTWVAFPSRITPESQSGTLTNLVLQYLHRPTTLTVARQGNDLVGRLTDDHGQPVAGAALTAEAVDVAGRLATEREVAGTVPKDAATAMIAIRANIESSCVCAGDGTTKIGTIHYREAGSNREADIAPGPATESSEAGPLRSFALTPTKTIVSNLKQIAVSGGARYTLSAPIAATDSSDKAGYVTAIFFDSTGKGLGRNMLWFRPSRQALPPITTGADGRFKLALAPNLAAAHPTVEVHYPGNANLRPALASIAYAR